MKNKEIKETIDKASKILSTKHMVPLFQHLLDEQKSMKKRIKKLERANDTLRAAVKAHGALLLPPEHRPLDVRT